jgi:hypothetical protein
MRSTSLSTPPISEPSHCSPSLTPSTTTYQHTLQPSDHTSKQPTRQMNSQRPSALPCPPSCAHLRLRPPWLLRPSITTTAMSAAQAAKRGCYRHSDTAINAPSEVRSSSSTGRPRPFLTNANSLTLAQAFCANAEMCGVKGGPVWADRVRGNVGMAAQPRLMPL